MQQKHKFHEAHSRTLVKTVTYRVAIIFTTLISSVIITGDYKSALQITLFANLVNTFVYYFHERIWNNIHWGKGKL